MDDLDKLCTYRLHGEDDDSVANVYPVYVCGEAYVRTHPGFFSGEEEVGY